MAQQGLQFSLLSFLIGQQEKEGGVESCARNNQKRKRKRKGVGRKKDTWRLLSPSKGTKEGIREKRKVTLGHFYGINDVIPVPSSRRVIQSPSLSSCLPSA